MPSDQAPALRWARWMMTISPCVLDLVSMGIGLSVLHRNLSRNAFLIGSLFMVLCLRPAFDFLCETIGFASGFRGDHYHIAIAGGGVAMWTFLAISIAFSLSVILGVISRFRGFPKEWEKGASRAVGHMHLNRVIQAIIFSEVR